MERFEHLPQRGRGAGGNPRNRFERAHFEWDPEAAAEASPQRTEILEEFPVSIITRNDSPDIPFRYSLNPYRGCEHGCAYCYARPTHEYLGFSAGLDFESRIIAKASAPELLAEALARASWEPEVLVMSGVTDPYQPVERERRITRRCLEVLHSYRNPVGIITKNALVERDLDLLQDMARWSGAVVNLSITSLDAELAREMEPRAASPRQRLETVRRLARAGVPVRVMVAPVIPGLNDTEVPAILDAAAEAGARGASWVPLRLPGAVKAVFLDWLERTQPGKKARVVDRLKDLRGGKLNQTAFHERFRGQGIWAAQLAALFELGLRRTGLNREPLVLSTAHFRRPGGVQGELFA